MSGTNKKHFFDKRIIRPSQETFFPLLGPMLGVAFQLHLEFVADANNHEHPAVSLFTAYNKKGLAYRDPSKNRVQIFEKPEVVVAGNVEHRFRQGWRAKALFSGKNRDAAKYVKVVLKRGDIWACCARANEAREKDKDKAFGFSIESDRNTQYVYLAYPGLSGQFEPLYVKVQNPNDNTFVYYRITAVDAAGEKDVLISIEMVSEDVAPFHLMVVEPMHS